MQVSSASDFDLFSQKVKEHTSSLIKKIEDEASIYVKKSEKMALQELKIDSLETTALWEHEYKAIERQEYKNIENDINMQWNAFKQERENTLYIQLKQELYKIFSKLAKSFILCVSNRYETGTFIIPKSYMTLVKGEKFKLHTNEDNKIIFKNGNLYIEYSVERIMEELHNDIASSMNFEENIWQI